MNGRCFRIIINYEWINYQEIENGERIIEKFLDSFYLFNYPFSIIYSSTSSFCYTVK